MFSRRGSDRRGAGDQPARTPAHAARRRERTEFGGDAATPESSAVTSTTGPFDEADAPADIDGLDLGSLLIPAVDGVEVRVQANPDGQIQQVVLINGENAVQVGVFAAPRSEGIWDEVREEIRDQIVADGNVAEETDGEFGVELRVRLRDPQSPGHLRFVGIDGPRWMIRAVYQGQVAADPSLAGPLGECLRGLVVRRGKEAMPVREPLALRLPREVHEHARHSAGSAEDSEGGGTSHGRA